MDLNYFIAIIVLSKQQTAWAKELKQREGDWGWVCNLTGNICNKFFFGGAGEGGSSRVGGYRDMEGGCV